MVFSSRLFPVRQAGEILYQDRFRQVELAVSFRSLTCHHCGFSAVYKYLVQQVRRQPEPPSSSPQEREEETRRYWRSIPRFAEIPETVKCKRCGEVLGLYPWGIY